MKVEKVLNNFSPVTITLESQEEIDKLFCLFNFTPICESDGLFHELYEKLRPCEVAYKEYWYEMIDKIQAHPAIRK